MPIHYRSSEEIEKIRAANRPAVAAHKRIAEILRPGVTTAELDKEAEKVIRDFGARPSFLGYRGFPATLCVAVNESVVHGIPDKTVLQEGDIIGLDLGAELDGYYGDVARTLPVGEVSEEATELMRVTKEALMAGIAVMRPGGRISDISHAIQKMAEQNGYNVVRSFVGHGIGSEAHEDPQVPNFGRPGRGPFLRKGMVLAIEPMINIGTGEVVVLDDKWTVKTADGELSAHFEHSVAVVEGGYDILSPFIDEEE